MNPNALDGALWTAERGLPVFRVVPNGKLPYRGGINEATTDPTIIRGWFEENPRLNYGIPAEDLVIVDVDPRKDPDGWFGELADLGDLPDTLQVISPSGGFHIYFDACGFDASQAPVSPCIDIRARGG